MTPDQELMVIFGALHLVALALGCVLFVMFLRSETTTLWEDPPDNEEGGGGGGGNDRLRRGPKSPSPGGIPLPDAEPARMRLRDHGRLADRHRPPRRREHAPRRTPRPRVPAR